MGQALSGMKNEESDTAPSVDSSDIVDQPRTNRTQRDSARGKEPKVNEIYKKFFDSDEEFDDKREIFGGTDAELDEDQTDKGESDNSLDSELENFQMNDSSNDLSEEEVEKADENEVDFEEEDVDHEDGESDEEEEDGEDEDEDNNESDGGDDGNEEHTNFEENTGGNDFIIGEDIGDEFRQWSESGGIGLYSRQNLTSRQRAMKGHGASIEMMELPTHSKKKAKMTEDDQIERDARRQANIERRKLLVQKRQEAERRAVVDKLIQQQEHSKSVRADDNRRDEREDVERKRDRILLRSNGVIMSFRPSSINVPVAWPRENPPEIRQCAVCAMPSKYACRKSLKRVCSLRCYKAVEQA